MSTIFSTYFAITAKGENLMKQFGFHQCTTSATAGGQGQFDSGGLARFGFCMISSSPAVGAGAHEGTAD